MIANKGASRSKTLPFRLCHLVSLEELPSHAGWAQGENQLEFPPALVEHSLGISVKVQFHAMSQDLDLVAHVFNFEPLIIFRKDVSIQKVEALETRHVVGFSVDPQLWVGSSGQRREAFVEGIQFAG